MTFTLISSWPLHVINQINVVCFDLRDFKRFEICKRRRACVCVSQSIYTLLLFRHLRCAHHWSWLYFRDLYDTRAKIMWKVVGSYKRYLNSLAIRLVLFAAYIDSRSTILSTYSICNCYVRLCTHTLNVRCC